MPGPIYVFGPWRLDAGGRVLRRNDQTVELTDRQLNVLLHLVSSRGEVVSKDALIDAVWRGTAVTDDSVEQVISTLRRALGEPSGRPTYIKTVPRKGYRFGVDVVVEADRATDEELDRLLAPYRAWVEGQAALEMLERETVRRAEAAFAQAVVASPEYAPVHLGLANACVMRFESTRADEIPDTDALIKAAHHAREACRLDPQLGEAWATLAFVLHRSGMTMQSIAAAHRAVTLEPDNWRHHFRLAYVSWGEERLRAARRTLALLPDFALARWLGATVHVARQVFDAAEHELVVGAAARDQQEDRRHLLGVVGSHWLLGLVKLVEGDEDEALKHFRRELGFESAGQPYGRECSGNTWYAIGAMLLRQGRARDAKGAFEHALDRVPGHIMSLAGLVAAAADDDERNQYREAVQVRAAQLVDRNALVDAALGRAALHVLDGNVDAAAHALDEALALAPAGSAGWITPVDPLLNVSAHEPAFRHVLARLRTRAA